MKKLLLFALVLLLLPFTVRALNILNTCGALSEGENELNNSVNNATGCLTIANNVNGVQLDCKGYNITFATDSGASTVYGINYAGISNNGMIKNCNIYGGNDTPSAATAISIGFGNVANITITNTNISQSGKTSYIYASSSAKNITISSCNINGTEAVTLDLIGGNIKNLTIQDSVLNFTMTGGNMQMVSFDGCPIDIVNNRITYTGLVKTTSFYGIRVTNTAVGNIRIINNTITTWYYGDNATTDSGILSTTTAARGGTWDISNNNFNCYYQQQQSAIGIYYCLTIPRSTSVFQSFNNNNVYAENSSAFYSSISREMRNNNITVVQKQVRAQGVTAIPVGAGAMARNVSDNTFTMSSGQTSVIEYLFSHNIASGELNFTNNKLYTTGLVIAYYLVSGQSQTITNNTFVINGSSASTTTAAIYEGGGVNAFITDNKIYLNPDQTAAQTIAGMDFAALPTGNYTITGNEFHQNNTIGKALGVYAEVNNLNMSHTMFMTKDYLITSTASWNVTLTNTTFMNVSSLDSIRFPGTIQWNTTTLNYTHIGPTYNRSYVNASYIKMFNTSAVITMAGLPYPLNASPLIAANDATFTPCGTVCSGMNYTSSTGTFAFTTSHWTTFASANGTLEASSAYAPNITSSFYISEGVERNLTGLYPSGYLNATVNYGVKTNWTTDTAGKCRLGNTTTDTYYNYTQLATLGTDCTNTSFVTSHVCTDLNKYTLSTNQTFYLACTDSTGNTWSSIANTSKIILGFLDTTPVITNITFTSDGSLDCTGFQNSSVACNDYAPTKNTAPTINVTFNYNASAVRMTATATNVSCTTTDNRTFACADTTPKPTGNTAYTFYWNSRGTGTSITLAIDTLTITPALPVSPLVFTQSITATLTSNTTVPANLSGTLYLANATDWRKNGASLALINMPFDQNITAGTTVTINSISTNQYANAYAATPNGIKWKANCKIGGCYSFNATANTWLVINKSIEVFPNNGFTMMAWAMPYGDNSSSTKGIFGGDQPSGTAANGTTINFATIGQDTYSYYYAGGNQARLAKETNLAWVHYALVTNATHALIYRNGVLNVTLTNTAAWLGSPNTNFTILLGARRLVTSGSLNGSIDDFRAYNQSMTPAFISQYYNDTTNGNAPTKISPQEAFIIQDNVSICAQASNGAFAGNLTCTTNATFDNNPPTCTLVSRTPADINESSTGTLNVVLNCYSPSGINVSSANGHYYGFVTRTVEGFVTPGLPNRWSIRPPQNSLGTNDTLLAAYGNIMRAHGRAEGDWYENINKTMTGSNLSATVLNDTYSYAVDDGSYTAFNLTITNTNTTNALFNYTVKGTRIAAWRENVPLSYESLVNEGKKNISVTSNGATLQVKVLRNDLEAMKGTQNYTIVVYRNVAPYGNPSGAFRAWYCNSSYTTGNYQTNSACTLINSITPATLQTLVFNDTNSTYSTGSYSITNGHIGTVAATPLHTYIYDTLESRANRGYNYRYANGATNTNTTFAQTFRTWTSTNNGVAWTQFNGTLDLLEFTSKTNDQFQFGYCAYSLNGNLGCNQTVFADNIDTSNLPISGPNIKYYNSTATQNDIYLNGTHKGVMMMMVTPGRDPLRPGGVNTTIILANSDGSYNYTVQSSIVSPDDSSMKINFTTTLVTDGHYYVNVTSQSKNVTSDIESTLTANNFTIDNTMPAYYSSTTTPASGLPYAQGTTYSFGSTWADATSGLASVNTTINGVTYAGNVTGLVLGAGTHYYNFTAADNAGNQNSTPTFTHTVLQASQGLNLTTNDAQGTTAGVNSAVNVSCSVNATDGTTNLSILKDGISLFAGTQGVNVLQAAWTPNIIGTYNISCNATNTMNYTGDRAGYNVVVQDTTAPTVTALFPLGGTFLQGWMNFSWTATDNYYASTNCTVYVDGVAKYPAVIVTNNTVGNVTVSTLNDATHSWYASCTDNSSNTGVSGVNSFVTATTVPVFNTNTTNPATPQAYAQGGNTVNFTSAWSSNQTITGINITLDGKTNATFIVNVTTGGTNTWCYQETANASTASDGSCSQSYTGAYSTTLFYVNMNYTKPAGALSTSRWQVKNGNTTVILNVSVAGCWNASATKLILRLYSNQTITGTQLRQSDAQCYTGSSWTSLNPVIITYASGGSSSDDTYYKVVDGNWSTYVYATTGGGWKDSSSTPEVVAPESLYEEAMWWNFASAGITTTNGSIVLPVIGAGTHYYNWTATDSLTVSNTTAQQAFIISQAGTVANITGNGSSADHNENVGGTITLQCNTTNTDGTASLTLYNNGTSNATGTSQLTVSRTVDLGRTNWTCVSSATQNFTASTSVVNIKGANTIAPTVTLDSPTGGVWLQSWQNFTWTTTSYYATTNCTLMLDSAYAFVTSTTGVNNKTITTVNDGLHYWNVTCSDTDGLTTTSATSSFTAWSNVPVFQSDSPNPASPATYSQGGTYTMRSTWTSNNTMASASLAWNGTTYGTIFSGGYRLVQFNNTPAGTYSYNWTGIDSVGLTNTTHQYAYTINTAAVITNLAVNGNGADHNEQVGSIVPVQCNTTNTDATRQLILYANATANATGTVGDNQLNTTTTVAFGRVNWICVSAATQNTTGGSDQVQVKGTDTVVPVVTLNEPSQPAYNRAWQNFTWTTTDNNDATTNCTLQVDAAFYGGITATNATPANKTVNAIADGTHYWNVTCSDSSGNAGVSSTRTFAVSTTAPTITITPPFNNTLAINTTKIPVAYEGGGNSPKMNLTFNNAFITNITVWFTTSNNNGFQWNVNIKNASGQIGNYYAASQTNGIAGTPINRTIKLNYNITYAELWGSTPIAGETANISNFTAYGNNAQTTNTTYAQTTYTYQANVSSATLDQVWAWVDDVRATPTFSSGTWQITTGPFGVGPHYITWEANDTFTNNATARTITTIITPATPTLAFSIASNPTPLATPAVFTCSNPSTDAGSTLTFTNGTQVINTGVSPITNITDWNAGNYTIQCNASSTQNYTASTSTQVFQVTPAFTINVNDAYNTSRKLRSFAVEWNGADYLSGANGYTVTLPVALSSAAGPLNFTVKSWNAYADTGYLFFNHTFTGVSTGTPYNASMNTTNIIYHFVYTGSTVTYNGSVNLTDTTFSKTYVNATRYIYNTAPSPGIHNYTYIGPGFSLRDTGAIISELDNRTIDIPVGIDLTFRFIDERTLAPWAIANTNRTTIQFFCTDGTMQSSNVPSNPVTIIQPDCVFDRYRVLAEYGNTTLNYYRTHLLNSTILNNDFTTYMIDPITTNYIVSVLQLLDVAAQYKNARVVVSRNLNGSEVQITGDYADIEGKITAYLIQYAQYNIRVISDNNGDRVIGNYYADVSGNKIVKLTDVQIAGNIGSFSANYVPFAYIINNSGTYVLYAGHNATQGFMNSDTITIHECNISGRILAQATSSDDSFIFSYTIGNYTNLTADKCAFFPEFNSSTTAGYNTIVSMLEPKLILGLQIGFQKMKFGYPDTGNWIAFILIMVVALTFTISTGYIGSFIVAALIMLLSWSNIITYPAALNYSYGSWTVPAFFLVMAILQLVMSTIKGKTGGEM